MAENPAADEAPQAEPTFAPAPPKRCPVLRAAQWAVNLLVLTAAVVVFTPLGEVLAGRLRRVDPLVRSDWLVVLGGTDDRLAEAARLYHQGWATGIIVSSTGPHADELATMAVQFQVPPERILIDNSPRRTADHPAGVAALPGVDPQSQSFILVTSEMHTSRSLAVFQKAGYRNVTVRAPPWDLPKPWDNAWQRWTHRARRLYTMTYEALAWLKYWLHGWV